MENKSASRKAHQSRGAADIAISLTPHNLRDIAMSASRHARRERLTDESERLANHEASIENEGRMNDWLKRDAMTMVPDCVKLEQSDRE